MTTLALVLALALSATGGNGHPAPGADGPAKAAQTTDSLVVRPATHATPTWNLMPATARRGQVWANVGFGAISDQYDANSNMQALGNPIVLPSSLRQLAGMLGVTDLPLPDGVDGVVQGQSARVTGQMSVVNVHVGGAYDILSRPGYSLSLGADLGLSQQNFQAEQVALDVQNATVSIAGGDPVPLTAAAAQMGLQIPQSIPNDARLESGFKAQSLSLFAGAKRANVAARAGYQFDIGPSAFEQDNSSFTDRQDAVLLGVSGRYPLGKIVVFASGESYITLGAETNGMSYDLGNLYGLNGGVGYDYGFGEIGAALTLRYRTEGNTVAAVGNQAFSVGTPSGYQFGIAPYVTVSPGNSPLSLYVKGGVQDEYRDYSLSIAGENDLAPHLGATFGLVYGF